MKLKEIYAEEFGCLSDRHFTPGEGLTLIEGENESGKSTLLALIRFLFYGFPRKNGPDGEERDRRLSWRMALASGSLTLTHGGKDFTVSRRFLLRGSAGREQPLETLAVSETDTGREVDLDGKTPGEYFLGLPAELYDSTLCVNQSDLARVGAPGVGEALGALLFSGESDFCADRAEKILQNARRELQYQRGRGGRMAELSDELSEIRAALPPARRDAEKLLSMREEDARLKKRLEETRGELEKTEEAARLAQLARELEHYDAAQKAAGEAKEAGAALAAAKERRAAEKLPDRATIEELRTALGAQKTAAAGEAAQKELADRLSAAVFQEKMIAAAEEMEKAGGEAALIRRFERVTRRAGSGLVFGLVFLLAALAAGAGAYLKFYPLYLGIGAGVLLLCSVFSFLLGGKARKKRNALRERTGLGMGLAPRTYLAQAKGEGERFLSNREQLTAARAMEKSFAAEREAAEADICRIFLSMGYDEGFTGSDAAEATLREVFARAATADNALSAASLRFEKAESAAAALSAGLEPEKEAALRAAYRAALEKLPGEPEDAERVRERRQFLSDKIRELEEAKAENARAEAALCATAADPEALTAAEHEKAAELAVLSDRLAALNMALSALSQAADSLRRDLFPRIAAEACTLLPVFTNGAYRTLRLDENFAVSLETAAGDKPLSRFSAGCRDAVHLALRLSLLRVMGGDKLPLLLDEALSRLDDRRAKSLLEALYRYTQSGGQCLLFSCHTREARLLSDVPGVTRISLSGAEETPETQPVLGDLSSFETDRPADGEAER